MARKSLKQRPKYQSPPQAPCRGRWLRPACLLLAAALVVATPLVPSERPELTGTALPLVMLWLLLGLGWIGGAAWLRVPRGRLSWIDGAALALAGWHAASGLAMMWHGAPRLTVNAVWTWVGFAATLVVLRQLLRTAGEIRALCAVMLALAVCLSVAGVYQRFVIYPHDRVLYEENPDQALALARLSAVEGSAQRKQFEDRLYSNEPTATFSLTNSLAAFLVPWLVVLLGIATVGVDGSRWERMRKHMFLAAVLLGAPLIGLCLLLTKSRTSWIAAAVGCTSVLVAVSLRHGTSRHLYFAAAGLAVLVALVGLLWAAGVFDIEIVTQAALSLSYRLEYWQSTLAMIADHPLFGCGPGNFQQYYAAYKLPQASETVADPHNFLLEVAATAGVPAVVLLAGLLILGFNRRSAAFAVAADESQANAEEAKSPERFAVLLLYAGGALGIPVAFAVGLITGYPPPMGGVLWGAAVGGVYLWLLSEWVGHGRLPHWLLQTAIAVLLLNFLAAGGIGFPGVALTLWVLLAATTCSRSRETSGDVSGHPVQNAADAKGVDAAAMPLGGQRGRSANAAAAIAAAALLAACYFSAYRPVLLRNGHLAQAAYALGQGRTDHALGELQAAAAADPLSADVPLGRAMLHFYRWKNQTQPAISDPQFRQFERHAAAALRLDRRAYQKRTAVGYLYLEAGVRSGEPSCREAAVGHFDEAARLYPHDAMTRAQLAWAAHEAGDPTKADAHAGEALRLDRLCPHSERKLAARRLLDEIATASPEHDLFAPAERMSAEQWMREIRSKVDAP